MAFKKRFKIGNRIVGEGAPVYLIAEIGRNHNGDMGLAKETIDAAVNSGADAVKFQSFKASELLIKELGSVSHVAATGGGKSIYELTEEVELTPGDHKILSDYAGSKGITFFSTPEDHSQVKVLADLNVPVFKIASLDIKYHDLISAIAAVKKPIILSTGMSYIGEVESSLLLLEKLGVDEVIVLQCTSNYPPRDEDLNLRAIETIRKAFGVPAGFSDHSFGIGASIASVALGACVIERHFTLDRNQPGTDHRISLEPDEFKLMAKEIRTVEKALGSAIKGPVKAEMEMRRLHCRRITAAREIPEGKALQREDIACKCSEQGLDPEYIPLLIGKKVKTSMKKDSPFLLDSIL